MDDPQVKPAAAPIAPGADAAPAPSGAEAADIKQQTSQDLLFFNVMPQDKNQGKMVESQIKNTAPSEAAKPGASFNWKEFLKKYKWYVIGVLAVLIGGPLIYFGVSKLGSGSYQAENVL